MRGGGGGAGGEAREGGGGGGVGEDLLGALRVVVGDETQQHAHGLGQLQGAVGGVEIVDQQHHHLGVGQRRGREIAALHQVEQQLSGLQQETHKIWARHLGRRCNCAHDIG